MKAISFEEVQKLLELKATELELDELVFNSTITYIENELGYKLEDKNYNEIQTIKNMEAYLSQNQITEMINIIDMNTKERIPNCVIDGQRIIFLHHQYEGHVAFFNYNAGFTPETLQINYTSIKILKKFNLFRNHFCHLRLDICFLEGSQETGDCKNPSKFHGLKKR